MNHYSPKFPGLQGISKSLTTICLTTVGKQNPLRLTKSCRLNSKPAAEGSCYPGIWVCTTFMGVARTGNQKKSYLKCLYCYVPKYLTIKFHPPPACLCILRHELTASRSIFLPCLKGQAERLSLARLGDGRRGRRGALPRDALPQAPSARPPPRNPPSPGSTADPTWPGPLLRGLRSVTCAAAGSRTGGRRAGGFPSTAWGGGGGTSPPPGRRGWGTRPRPLRGSAHLRRSCLQPTRSSQRRGRGGEMRLRD